MVLLLAVIAARDAAAGVILTSRSSQIEIDGGANEGGPTPGGYAYSPLPTGSVSTMFSFIDTQSGIALSPSGYYRSSSRSDQSSVMTFDGGDLAGVFGSGYTRAYATNPPGPPPGGAGATAESFFDVFFTVSDTPVGFVLSGEIRSDGGLAEVSLVKTGEDESTIYSVSVAGPDSSSLSLFDSGDLEPGTYQLHMRSFATNPFDGTSTSAFDATLYVPEPATLALLAMGGLAMLRRRK